MSNQRKRPGGLAALHKSALRSLFSGSGATTSATQPGGKKRARRAADEEPSSQSSTASADEDDIASLRQELDSLRRRKALLAGEVEQLRSGCVGSSENIATTSSSLAIDAERRTCTVADELEHVRSRANASRNSRKGLESSSNHIVSGDDKWSDRQYLHKYDDRDGVGMIVGRNRRRSRQDASSPSITTTTTTSAALSSNGDDANDDIDCAISEAIDAARQEVRARTLAEHMHTVRTQRRIAAAHRLAGISALPLGGRMDEENVLGVRIDVCKDGSFVARYHVFFEMVMVPDEEQSNFFRDASDGNATEQQCFRTVLRLAQHTLPTPGVSTQPILRKHFGPEGMLPIGDEDGDDVSQNKEAILNKVRRCLGDLSDACHSFTMRRDACRYLDTKETLNKRSAQFHLQGKQFRNVAHNDSFDRVSFDFHYQYQNDGDSTIGENEYADLTVQLIYDNQLTSRPTSMRIKAVQSLSETNNWSKDQVGSSSKADRSTSVGDGGVDDDGHHAILIEELKESLLSDPLPSVFEQKFDSLFTKCKMRG